MAKQTVILNVEGMSCKHCENRVIKSVSALNGVSDVNVDLKGKKVTVKYDDETVTVDDISKTIDDEGYEVT